MNKEIDAVLDFWFAKGREAQWFKKSDGFDREVASALTPYFERAVEGAYDTWLDDPWGALALVILLDQVPRNIFRDSQRCYAHDDKSRAVTFAALERGYNAPPLSQQQQIFLFLPLEHSENLNDQELCCELVAGLDEDPTWLEWSQMHRDVIARFGRFPHRNSLLGRENTAEEIAFLKGPNSSF